jgi:hypothetical protein
MSSLSKDDDNTSNQNSEGVPQAERIEDSISNLPDKHKVIASKISKFAQGFKIPDEPRQ